MRPVSHSLGLVGNPALDQANLFLRRLRPCEDQVGPRVTPSASCVTAIRPYLLLRVGGAPRPVLRTVMSAAPCGPVVVYPAPVRSAGQGTLAGLQVGPWVAP